MIGFDLSAYSATLLTETGETAEGLRFDRREEETVLYVNSPDAGALQVDLTWAFAAAPSALVLGDAFERAYGDLGFLPLESNDRPMPWYFLIADGEDVFCLGVKTGANAFVSFRAVPGKVTATVDLRNGADPVYLGERTLEACTFVSRLYHGKTPFDALCDFCRRLCPAPVLPDSPVYGGNDWYYAYGNNSPETVLASAKLVAELSAGIPTRPFMVVDEGWSVHRESGPWLPGEHFGDMAALAQKIRALGVRPGLWIRPLKTEENAVPAEALIERGGKREYLDPTHPAAQTLIAEDVRRVKSWGYDLLKFDFTTYDLFGNWGKDLADRITNEENWHFYDRAKTNAEIVLDLYRLIRKAAGDMLLIGCNTVSHLTAGICELNRVGDDTSGKDWARTKKMGINALAFRLAQNNAFYLVDADCVGMIPNAIPWAKNGAFLDLLSRSATALFVSCLSATEEEKRDLAAAFRRAQTGHGLRPLDWTVNPFPERWRSDGEETRYQW